MDGLATDGRTPLPVPLPVPLAVPLSVRLRSGVGFVVLRSDIPPAERASHYGIPCVDVGRALFDEVRRRGEVRAAAAAVDMVLAARLADRAELTGYAGVATICSGMPASKDSRSSARS